MSEEDQGKNKTIEQLQQFKKELEDIKRRLVNEAKEEVKKTLKEEDTNEEQ